MMELPYIIHVTTSTGTDTSSIATDVIRFSTEQAAEDAVACFKLSSNKNGIYYKVVKLW